MYIQFHKDFKKDYARLNSKQKERVNISLQLFQQNPFEKTLRNHALVGKLKGKRAISAGGDIRIVFEEKDKYMFVVFLHVGSHNHVY